MSAISKIEWTDRTWNPVRGCSVVSPGCVNCYAMKFAHRFSGPGKPYDGLTKQTSAGPQWTGVLRLAPEHVLMQPYRWKTPCRVFVNSMSDLFHESLSNEQIAEVFHVIYGEASTVPAPRHTYQILTKRPARMAAWFDWLRNYNGPDEMILALAVYLVMEGPHKRVWLGTSVEDRARTRRIDMLRGVPAAVRFLSIEPLLEDIGQLDLSGIDWVIVGGESGPGARPCHEQWLRDIVKQCRAAAVPCFVKQVGSCPIAVPYRGSFYEWRQERFGDDWRVRLRDRKGGDITEWPDDLRVRQFPLAGPLPRTEP